MPCVGPLNTGARIAAVLTVMLVLGACGPDPATPRGVAERFLDAYFGLDLAAASEMSAHRARELVEEERRLTAGQRIDAETRVPTIRYRLIREEPGDGAMVHLVYEVRVVAPDAEPSEERWLVTLGRVGPAWKVLDFSRVPG